MAVKAVEDILDTLFCAWAGICAFEGAAMLFGVDTCVMWIPQSELLASRRGRP